MRKNLGECLIIYLMTTQMTQMTPMTQMGVEMAQMEEMILTTM
jgi:hypothetical protein